MKAILEFNLPDDNVDYKLATNASKYHNFIWEMEQYLRTKTKYAPDDLPQDKYDAYDEVREKFYELVNEMSIDLDL